MFVFFIVHDAVFWSVDDELPRAPNDDGVVGWRELEMVILCLVFSRLECVEQYFKGWALTLTTLSQCWEPVCLMNPSGALMAATHDRSGRIRLLNSGRRWEAHLFVVWTTVRARSVPRCVLTVIQPSASRSDTCVTGVCACRLRFPFSKTMRRSACTNLYGHLVRGSASLRASLVGMGMQHLACRMHHSPQGALHLRKVFCFLGIFNEPA